MRFPLPLASSQKILPIHSTRQTRISILLMKSLQRSAQ